MLIEWTEDLAVGIAEIDNQHRELFSRINQLLEACTQGKGKDAVSDIVRFLEEYVVVHFSAEEKLMEKYSYPDYRDHKKLHEQFVTDFSGLKEKLETEGPGPHIVIMTNRVVVTWLNSHIRNVDKNVGAYLKTKL